MKDKGFSAILAILAIVVIASIAGRTYYLGLQQKQSNNQANTSVINSEELDNNFLKSSPLFSAYTVPFTFSQAKSAVVNITKASYGPPYDSNLYELTGQSMGHLFAKSRVVNLSKFEGQQVTVQYRDINGVIMGETQAVIVDSVSTLNSSTPNPTVNWETYTSNKYHFQLKYPKTVKIDYQTDANGNSVSDLPSLYNSVYGKDSARMYINVLDNPNNLEAKAFIDSKNAEAEKKDSEPFILDMKNWHNTTINGINAYQGTSFGFDSTKFDTFIHDGKYIIEITFDDSNPNNKYTEENKKVYLSILSTFKFTN